MVTPEKLDPDEWLRFYNLVYSQFLALGEQYQLSDVLVVERGAYEDIFANMFRYPGIRTFWKSMYAYDPDWAAHVQAIFDRTQAASESELLEDPIFSLPQAPGSTRGGGGSGSGGYE